MQEKRHNESLEDNAGVQRKIRRDTLLEDRTTIRILKEQKLAVSISECGLEHINAVVERMDRELSDGSSVFMKCNKPVKYPFFEKETDGLAALRSKSILA